MDSCQWGRTAPAIVQQTRDGVSVGRWLLGEKDGRALPSQRARDRLWAFRGRGV
jgi:hypothetical protein